MDVIFIMVDCFDLNEWIMLRDFRQLNLKVGKNSLIEYRLSVFGYKNDMVVTLVDTV